jgi:hypothetical protein
MPHWGESGSAPEIRHRKEICMLMTLALVLLLIWGIGSLAFHAVGGLIHILLVLAVVSMILHFVRGRGRRARI